MLTSLSDSEEQALRGYVNTLEGWFGSRPVEVPMDRTAALAQRICEQTRRLPETSLLELERYIEFLEFKTERRHLLRERLTGDHDELAAFYEELAGELSDEVWLPVENEALYRTDQDTDR